MINVILIANPTRCLKCNTKGYACDMVGKICLKCWGKLEKKGEKR